MSIEETAKLAAELTAERTRRERLEKALRASASKLHFALRHDDEHESPDTCPLSECVEARAALEEKP